MAHLRFLNVHSVGRKYSQGQLAQVLSDFVERIEGSGRGSTPSLKGTSPPTQGRWAEPIHRIFRNTKIDSRYLLWDPAKGMEHPRRAEEVMPDLLAQNTKIASECITRTLDSCSLKPTDIDNVFFSSPLFSAPSISYLAMNHVPFRRDVKHSPMMGLGCAGGVALLGRATDYLRAYPKQSALLLTVESGTRFWYGTLHNAFTELLSKGNPDKEKVMQQVVLAALFGDAISCSVMHGMDSPFLHKNNKNKTNSFDTNHGNNGTMHKQHRDGPLVVDSQSLFVDNSVDLVSHHVESSGLQSYLSPKLGKVAPAAMVEAVEQLLQRNNLRKSDINHWFAHAGGPAMLNYLENTYGLTRAQLQYSWRTLAEVGNISSATVPRTYELLMQSENVGPGYGVMVAAGPGLSIEAVLLKWS
jgi:alkylresorcinol/alkylpyrone synthase